MKKLQLQRETLQVLSADHLSQVAGGTYNTRYCFPTLYGCGGGSGTGGSRYNCPQPQ